MLQPLRQALHSKNGLVRKAGSQLLRIPKWWAGARSGADALRDVPPVLANSFPKSGTHLLDQILAGLQDRQEYGAFLSSMTSSFQFRERSPESTTRFIRAIVPGELVRAHLFHDERYAATLQQMNVVHYFIYRDPRDVVVSDTHYLREMNRWHRMHRYFRSLPTLEDAITFSIQGFEDAPPGIYYPNIAERFSRYEGWLANDSCLSVRFEDLVSKESPFIVQRIAEFYAEHCSDSLDVPTCARRMRHGIAPEKSHTYRQGQRGGWRAEFTADHRRLFAQVASDLLIRLGYETDDSWVEEMPAKDPAPHVRN